MCFVWDCVTWAERAWCFGRAHARPGPAFTMPLPGENTEYITMCKIAILLKHHCFLKMHEYTTWIYSQNWSPKIIHWLFYMIALLTYLIRFTSTCMWGSLTILLDCKLLLSFHCRNSTVSFLIWWGFSLICSTSTQISSDFLMLQSQKLNLADKTHFTL